MSDTNSDSDPNDDLPRVDTLERRLTELEKQNNQLEAALDQRQHRALPDVTRRQTLGGFLLGGALVGAGGFAGVQLTDSDDISDDNSSDKDISDNLLNIQDLYIETVNNRIEVTTNDDLVTKLHQAPRRRTRSFKRNTHRR